MADSKITALTAISTVDPTADPLVIVDVSDTSMAASGTTKKSTINQLLGSGGTATLASATITGALTVNGGIAMANATSLTFGGELTLSSNSAAGLFIRGRATGGITFQESSGTQNLLTMSNAGVFTFFDGAGGTRMTLNSTGLAIGDTAFAGTRLTLRESASQPNALAMTNRNATQTWRIGVDVSAVDDKILGFYDSTSTTFRIQLTDTGNLGLGVTPSAWGSSNALQIGSWASLSSANAYGVGIGFNNYYNGTNHIYSFNNGASKLELASGLFKFFTAPSGTAGNAITFTQAMTLDASGNLLVGVTSGSNKLVVSGSAEITGGVAGQGALIGRDGSSGGGTYGSNTGNTNVNAPASGGIRFNVNSGTGAAQFDTSGNFIPTLTATAPTLTTNRQMAFNLTSDTNLRISVRGADGTTRTANITLA